MSNSLDKIQIIERTRLNEEFYFQSLLEQAENCGLLSLSDIEKLQLDCISLLAYKTKLCNSGDSSSIPVEKAQDIMNSNLFTIGLELKSFPYPDDAVAALLTEPLNGIYQKGRRRIGSMLAEVKTLHARLTLQLINSPNEFYSSTLVDGINGFFKLYYPDFSAQEIHITADYPLFNPSPRLLGIEFIKNYVEAAWYENQFCRCFSDDDIHYLLLGFSEGYQDLLINIYEQVLTAALGCVITGTDCSRLNITNEEIRRLTEIFRGRSRQEIAEMLTGAADELESRFQFSHGLNLYVRNSLDVVTDNIYSASRENILRRVFFPCALAVASG